MSVADFSVVTTASACLVEADIGNGDFGIKCRPVPAGSAWRNSPARQLRG